MIKQFYRVACGLSLLGAWMAAFFIVLIACMILLEIVLRTFFATSTYMMDELVGYSVAASAFLALGHTFDQREMIRITLLLSFLEKRPVLRLLIEWVCIIATLAMVGYLARYFYLLLERQYVRGYSSGTMSGMPQWIPTSAVFAGLLIFWIQSLAYGLVLWFERSWLMQGDASVADAVVGH